jgi:hypothetical protein
MRLILLALLITLPYFSFAQGFTLKIGAIELPTDRIPDFVDLPLRVEMFFIKKDASDPTPQTYTLQIGEEEHTFQGNGQYHQVTFSHDIKGLVATILDENRKAAAKPFILRRRQ